jgi:hypothetical protein
MRDERNMSMGEGRKGVDRSPNWMSGNFDVVSILGRAVSVRVTYMEPVRSFSVDPFFSPFVDRGRIDKLA